MGNIKVIIFDFDGVIVLDSDAIFKQDAWGIILKPWSGRYELFFEEACQFYSSGNAGGRNEILSYVLQKVGEPPERIFSLTTEFDEYVQKKILESGLTPGTKNLLAILAQKNFCLYINSGTDTEALVSIIGKLGINDFFRGIFGSNGPSGGCKVDNFKRIAFHEGVKPKDILFIGDNLSDYKSAQIFGCHFIGFSNKWNNWSNKNVPFPVVAKLGDIVNVFDESCFWC